MSFETALEFLAESIRDLAAAVHALNATKDAPPAAVTVSPKRNQIQEAPRQVQKEVEAAAHVTLRYDDVREAVVAYATAKGDAEARKLLATFINSEGKPCRSAKELLQAQYAGVIEAFRLA